MKFAKFVFFCVYVWLAVRLYDYFYIGDDNLSFMAGLLVTLSVCHVYAFIYLKIFATDMVDEFLQELVDVIRLHQYEGVIAEIKKLSMVPVVYFFSTLIMPVILFAQIFSNSMWLKNKKSRLLMAEGDDEALLYRLASDYNEDVLMAVAEKNHNSERIINRLLDCGSEAVLTVLSGNEVLSADQQMKLLKADKNGNTAGLLAGNPNLSAEVAVELIGLSTSIQQSVILNPNVSSELLHPVAALATNHDVVAALIASGKLPEFATQHAQSVDTSQPMETILSLLDSEYQIVKANALKHPSIPDDVRRMRFYDVGMVLGEVIARATDKESFVMGLIIADDNREVLEELVEEFPEYMDEERLGLLTRSQFESVRKSAQDQLVEDQLAEDW